MKQAGGYYSFQGATRVARVLYSTRIAGSVKSAWNTTLS